MGKLTKFIFVVLMLSFLLGCKSLEVDGLQFKSSYNSFKCFDSESKITFYLEGDEDELFSGRMIGVREDDTIHVSNYLNGKKNGSLFHAFSDVIVYKTYVDDYVVEHVELDSVDTVLIFNGAHLPLVSEGDYESIDCLYLDRFCGRIILDGKQTVVEDSCIYNEYYRRGEYISSDTICKNE